MIPRGTIDGARDDVAGARGCDESEAARALRGCSAVLTHHWLVRARGGEKVLRALCELLPGAPIYTFVHDARGAGPGWPEVHTTWLGRLPGAARYYPHLLPLMPAAARATRLPDVDLVVCSDAALAKAMRAGERSVVVCYCHSPPRYLWDLADEHRSRLPAVLRPLWDLWLPRLRRADREAASRVDVFVANSRHVSGRIRRCYGRESEVVYPPVELPAQAVVGAREDYYVCLGYHVPYKRLDVAIGACEAVGRRLVVIGDGPDVARLRGRRGVEFLGWQPDEVVHEHLSRARGLLFAGEEDFGMVPVEAIARGCGVVAFGVGGACETVEPGRNGVLFDRQDVAGMAGAIRRYEGLSLDPSEMLESVRRFGSAVFRRAMSEVLVRALARGRGRPGA